MEENTIDTVPGGDAMSRMPGFKRTCLKIGLMMVIIFVSRGAMKNIILIGMPGCGKSTIGVLLAKAMGFRFIDTDITIQNRTGMLLQQIIDQKGLDWFCIEEERAIMSVEENGGVVPEIASRRHCESIVGVVQEALDRAGMKARDVDAIAVSFAPGLIGALLVGVNFAKGLALALNKPLIPVHHIRGHIAANYLAHPELEPPYLCLVASGSHSHIVKVNSWTEFETIGQTVDDAAGEARPSSQRR